MIEALGEVLFFACVALAAAGAAMLVGALQ
jgi:hypothetical protein